MSHVTITDPHHPLAGQRFPVVALCAPQGPHKLVIALPDGRQRAVRRSVTDLNPAVPVRPSDLLEAPRLGTRTLLSLARSVRDMLASQEIPDVPAPTAPPSALGSASAASLAADVPRPAAATGAALGPLTPADATTQREGEATC